MKVNAPEINQNALIVKACQTFRDRHERKQASKNKEISTTKAFIL